MQTCLSATFEFRQAGVFLSSEPNESKTSRLRFPAAALLTQDVQKTRLLGRQHWVGRQMVPQYRQDVGVVHGVGLRSRPLRWFVGFHIFFADKNRQRSSIERLVVVNARRCRRVAERKWENVLRGFIGCRNYVCRILVPLVGMTNRADRRNLPANTAANPANLVIVDFGFYHGGRPDPPLSHGLFLFFIHCDALF